MPAAVERPLTVEACDQALKRLARKLHDPSLASYELELFWTEIDEWLERRTACALAAESR